MRFRLPVVSFLLIALVAACAKRDPVANDLKPLDLPAPADASTGNPAGGPAQNRTAAAAEPAATGTAISIPAALQGRWGLTPGDCVGPLDSAKGLLVIKADELRFYESRAVPSPDVQTDGATTRGTFHFTGEGQAWNKFESLKSANGKLTRTEGNPTASYTYAKC